RLRRLATPARQRTDRTHQLSLAVSTSDSGTPLEQVSFSHSLPPHRCQKQAALYARPSGLASFFRADAQPFPEAGIRRGGMSQKESLRSSFRPRVDVSTGSNISESLNLFA